MEDASGTLKLHKCKVPARPGGRALSNLVPRYYGPGSEACTCDGGDPQLSLPGRRKKFFKKSECGSPGGAGRAHACGGRMRSDNRRRQGAGATVKPPTIHPLHQLQGAGAKGEDDQGVSVCQAL